MEDPRRAGTYEIVVAATLPGEWTAWFDGFDVTVTGVSTRLLGTGIDQAALHGVLARCRDLNLPILGVRRLDDGGTPDVTAPDTPRGT